ncbi:hypothetical protein [Mesorhizobium sp. SP-1A]|uniref:hypothetical protein n=1 Tax=Mesorhizobium sp. SP-1A TaxID=3077840 RepID=UPI0028F6CD58|nr:hypothetical protein [Mesorhizobium sp. SP-1A]
MKVGPAKREGNPRVIFDQELESGEMQALSPTRVVISITADSLYRKSGNGDNSSYRYDIILSAEEIVALTNRMAGQVET